MRVMHTVRVIVAVSTVLAASSQVVTVDERPSVAIQNIRKLDVRISVDHPIYVPGETMTFAVSVRNPTSQSLQIPNPFWPKRAGFDFLERRRRDPSAIYGTEFTYASSEPYSSFPPRDDDLIVLQAFDTVSQTIRSDDPRMPHLASKGGAPYRVGSYKVVYSYAPGSSAVFSVAQDS